MDDVVKLCIIKLLKKAGFESIEAKALEIIIEVHKDRLSRFLQTIVKLSTHASRPSVSLLDSFGVKHTFPHIGKELRFSKEMLIECHTDIPICRNKSVQNIFSLIVPEKTVFPNSIQEEEVEWCSPLSGKIEKFIHIYEFMPNFPPIHTFRLTPLKSSIFKNQSAKVKNRLEQSLRSEENMVKLIKSSGSMPNFINYLYRRKI
ncbi:hypothetical protein GINT2_000511 [Glugoides intestinalis]